MEDNAVCREACFCSVVTEYCAQSDASEPETATQPVSYVYLTYVYLYRAFYLFR